MNTFLVTVGVGLATAAILALSALAFTLEYAVSRIANSPAASSSPSAPTPPTPPSRSSIRTSRRPP